MNGGAYIRAGLETEGLISEGAFNGGAYIRGGLQTEGLISEGAYKRNRKSPSKQAITVLIKIRFVKV